MCITWVLTSIFLYIVQVTNVKPFRLKFIHIIISSYVIFFVQFHHNSIKKFEECSHFKSRIHHKTDGARNHNCVMEHNWKFNNLVFQASMSMRSVSKTFHNGSFNIGIFRLAIYLQTTAPIHTHKPVNVSDAQCWLPSHLLPLFSSRHK